MSATITDVTTPLTLNTVLGIGQQAIVTVDFSQAVNVDTSNGTPTLQLNDSAGSTASYISGSGTRSLQFAYTVPTGDTTNGQALDYTSTALNLNGGAISDVSNSVAAHVTLPTAGGANDNLAAANVVLDATMPTVQQINAPSGTYGQGPVFPIDVTFSEAVNVTGTPTLTLNATHGNNPVTAIYISGSGSTDLIFTYTVVIGDTTNGQPLDVTALNTDANDTITDMNGVAAATTLPNPGSAGSLSSNSTIIIDATIPAVVGVSTPIGTGVYPAGTVIPISVVFSEPVTVQGTATLTMSDGGVATYTSGSGSSTLLFTYTVANGDSTNGQPLDVVALNTSSNDAITSLVGMAASRTIHGDTVAGRNLVIGFVPPTPTPTPSPPSIADQMQQLFQDIVTMEQCARSGDVSDFFAALQNYESLLVSVEQEIFHNLLSSQSS